MNIPAKQVAYRKRIGHLGSTPVYGIGTVGGLHLVVAARSGGFETLGAGSHPGIARHLAKQHGDVTYDSLDKSEDLDVKYFIDTLHEWVELTNQLRAAQGY